MGDPDIRPSVRGHECGRHLVVLAARMGRVSRSALVVSLARVGEEFGLRLVIGARLRIQYVYIRQVLSMSSQMSYYVTVTSVT